MSNNRNSRIPKNNRQANADKVTLVKNEDYQVLILKMPAGTDDDTLVSIDNEAEFNEVWALFEDRLSDDYEIKN